MSNESIDQYIESMLTRSEAEIADDGFSEIVMRRLPRKRLNLVNSRRVTLATAAAMGSALTILLAPPLEVVFKSYNSVLGEYANSVFIPVLLATLFILPLAWLFRSE